MAAQVAGDLYESITGQLFEIGRQLRQPNGYPFSPEALKAHLQDAIEGRLNGAVARVKKLLELVTTASVGAIKSFKSADNFKVDTKKAATRIYYLGDNFEKHFGRKEEGASEAVEIKVYKLLEWSLDAPIITELADKCEITLGQFFSLLSKQGKGESGPLLTDGWANIAYIRDDEGILWAVDAFWRADRGGWIVGAHSVERPDRWYDGRRVLSR
jgi:hypothetical protein